MIMLKGEGFYLLPSRNEHKLLPGRGNSSFLPRKHYLLYTLQLLAIYNPFTDFNIQQFHRSELLLTYIRVTYGDIK